jgi:hypothetical protein
MVAGSNPEFKDRLLKWGALLYQFPNGENFGPGELNLSGVPPLSPTCIVTTLAMDYPFPYVQVADLSDIDPVIRPSDQAQQMFGRERQPSFSDQGIWIVP